MMSISLKNEFIKITKKNKKSYVFIVINFICMLMQILIVYFLPTINMKLFDNYINY